MKVVLFLALFALAWSAVPERDYYKDEEAASKLEKEGVLVSNNEERIQPPTKGTCSSQLYILAFTSKLQDSQSDTDHMLELRVNGVTIKKLLYDRLGNDMMTNKGDLWKFDIGCVRICDIDNVAIVSASNDGWNIESIVTMVKDASGKTKVLTQDLDVNRWIDGDDLKSHLRFDLTFA